MCRTVYLQRSAHRSISVWHVLLLHCVWVLFGCSIICVMVLMHPCCCILFNATTSIIILPNPPAPVSFKSRFSVGDPSRIPSNPSHHNHINHIKFSIASRVRIFSWSFAILCRRPFTDPVKSESSQSYQSY